jgi:molybdopterin-guanine dinucleotide biosynthesis protein A
VNKLKRAGVVLCGGRSSRMGRPKHSLEIAGKSLLQQSVESLATVVDEIVIAAAADQSLPVLPADQQIIVVRDRWDTAGPLSGIASSFAEMKSEVAVVLTCDAPFVKAALLKLLFDGLGGDDIAIGSTGQPQFFPGVYRRCVGDSAAALLQKGVHRVGALLQLHAVKMIDEAELRSVDPELNSYRDVDTPEEFEALVKSAGD